MMTFEEKFEAWQEWMQSPTPPKGKLLGIPLIIWVIVAVIFANVALDSLGIKFPRGIGVYLRIAIAIPIAAVLGAIAVWKQNR
jgi:hypothetical protein